MKVIGVLLILILSYSLVHSNESLKKFGQHVYQTHCIGCHGVLGNGKGKGARLLVVKPRDFTGAVFKFKSTPIGSLPLDSDLMWTVTNGLPGSAMPSFPLFSEKERYSVVQYIKTFSERWTKETPEPPITVPYPPAYLGSEESIARGQELYEEEGCVLCHGDFGDGKGPGGESIEDIWGNPMKPRNFTLGIFRVGSKPQNLFKVITSGIEGTIMPDFSHLSEDERWDLITYVLYFKSKGHL